MSAKANAVLFDKSAAGIRPGSLASIAIALAAHALAILSITILLVLVIAAVL